MPDVFTTSNKYGTGEVRSWASLLDYNCRQQAEAISRAPGIDGYIALMPDAHHGYGPPVGSAIRTRDVVMPYNVGVDIGCGVVAYRTTLQYDEVFDGSKTLDRAILGEIRKRIPSGNSQAGQHEQMTQYAEDFFKKFGDPPGAHLTKHGAQHAVSVAKKQFGSLGGGNHFLELATDETGRVWLLLHSGSRGIGNQLATAHVKIAQEKCKDLSLESKEFAYLERGTPEYDAYLADMHWAQNYAYEQRMAMMTELMLIVHQQTGLGISGYNSGVHCHHNYAEEVEPGVILTRKGAIDASAGKMGIIPGSMGAATCIVEGKGNAEAYNTSAHGAGRLKSRGAAKRELDLEAFKEMMGDRTWEDRHAEALLDEAPDAYKPIDVVIADSYHLVTVKHVLSQFINYKGVESGRAR